VNHKKAPVELREKLAFDAKTLPAALDVLRGAAASTEEVILSTCNRVEAYFLGSGDEDVIARFLAAHHGRTVEEVRPVLYRHAGLGAVRHLFEVASSLDSMVVGETQIIAQVKQAYFAAKEAGHTGRVFNPLFQRALAVAKRIHSETGIVERSVSVPSVAARLAEKIFQGLAGRRVLVLGAGETGALTLAALRERGVRDVTVVNRTVERARGLAEEAHGLEDLPAVLPRADIVIACLSCERPVLGPAEVRTALRARRNEPMFIIDIAVPRNVDPEVDHLDDAYLFNIDDLQETVNQNLLEREQEMARCAPLIEEEAGAAFRETATIDVQEVLTRLRSAFEAVGDEELKRTLARLESLSGSQREEVQALVHRIVSKLLHPPTTAIKTEAANGQAQRLIELASRLFDLK